MCICYMYVFTHTIKLLKITAFIFKYLAYATICISSFHDTQIAK